MYVADGAGRLVMTNPAFDALLAARSQGDESGAADVAPAALRKIFARLANGDEAVECDETFGTNGTRRRYRSSHYRVVEPDGAIAFAGQYFELSADADGPETVQRHAAVDHHAAAAARNAFFGKMSHEMRTPLNAIIGFAEMSESQPFGPLDSRYVAYLRNIGDAARHLSNMVGDLLELARLSVETKTENEGASIAGTLAAARTAVAELAARRGVDLRGVETPDTRRVIADRERFQRICVNLLDNAVKYTEAGGRVGVEIARAEPAGMIDMVFWDTGIGIARNRHERIFESFHHVDPHTLLCPTESAGLGLAVSRHLARLMDGDITVDSAPGEGARFTLRLPAAPG